MRKYRVLEETDFYGDRLYRPQERHFLVGWSGWHNPMTKQKVEFRELEDAIEHIEKLKRDKAKTYYSYYLNRK